MKRLRNNRGMTIDDVAQKAGLRVEDVEAYEAGDREPVPSHVYKIAQALGASVYELHDDLRSLEEQAKACGQNLAKLRKDKGKRADEFSTEIGISKLELSFFESGEAIPETELLKKFADALGVSVEELLG